MADLTITAANVVKTSGVVATGTSGATITAGMAIYVDSADAVQIASCVTSAITAAVGGIALNGASSGQPVEYLKTGGVMNLGATLAVGKPYVLSTAGLIAPVDDLLSADYTTVIGVATTTALITLAITASGVQVP